MSAPKQWTMRDTKCGTRWRSEWLLGLFFGPIAWGASGLAAYGQTSYSADAWPEIDLVYRLDDRNKLIGLFDQSRNRDSTGAYQAEVGVTFEHQFTNSFWGRIGYRHANATDGSAFEENRLLLEQTFRVPLPALVKVDFRTREDLRWLNTGFSARFRERMQVQRDTTIGNYTFTPYVSAEVYFDTRFDQFSRYRLIAGTAFPLTKHITFEPYYAHQVDFAGSSAIVDALGLILTASF